MVVLGGSNSIWFEPNGSGGWQPEFASHEQLIHQPGHSQFLLIRTDGSRLEFYDESAATALEGALWAR